MSAVSLLQQQNRDQFSGPLLLIDRRHRENFLIEQNDWLARVNPNDRETLLDYLVKIQSP